MGLGGQVGEKCGKKRNNTKRAKLVVTMIWEMFGARGPQNVENMENYARTGFRSNWTSLLALLLLLPLLPLLLPLLPLQQQSLFGDSACLGIFATPAFQFAFNFTRKILLRVYVPQIHTALSCTTKHGSNTHAAQRSATTRHDTPRHATHHSPHPHPHPQSLLQSICSIHTKHWRVARTLSPHASETPTRTTIGLRLFLGAVSMGKEPAPIALFGIVRACGDSSRVGWGCQCCCSLQPQV